MVDQYIADEERDQILDRLLQQPENKVSKHFIVIIVQTCFDCKSKNPKWASSNIGIFLCYQCTSVHRNYGVHISFVRYYLISIVVTNYRNRSLKMDRWKPKEIK